MTSMKKEVCLAPRAHRQAGSPLVLSDLVILPHPAPWGVGAILSLREILRRRENSEPGDPVQILVQLTDQVTSS